MIGLFFILGLSATAADVTRRYALVVGANDGGAERARLQWATSDADTFAGVMGDLGGVLPADRLVIYDPDPDALLAALASLKTRIATTPGSRKEVLFYYSGHSDEQGLLLHGQHLSYARLREGLKAINSDVKIAILDSCSSGALVQAKGGRHVPGFLEDGALGNQVEGHAFLTSSSADEVSQEAASVGGSFFTNALVTGLRGGADVNNDGLVTLHEAYRFAYDETLARTESTRFGPQHANFDMQLSGSGDLVMTDLRESGASLTIAAPIEGRILVRDEHEKLVAELHKRSGAPLTLRLRPGRYKVTLHKGEEVLRAPALVDSSTVRSLGPEAFAPIPLAVTAARGDTPGDPSANTEAEHVLIEVLGDIGFEMKADQSLDLGLSLMGDRMDGAAIALTTTVYREDVFGAQLSLAANSAGGHAEGTQLSLGANNAGSLDGAQLSLGINTVAHSPQPRKQGPPEREASVRGVQGTLGANFSQGPVWGAQGALGANFAQGDLFGFQGALGLNYVKGDLSGAQVSQGVNIGQGDVTGAQVGMVLNTAHDVSGTQLSTVNVARDVTGLQGGVVNVAHHVDGSMLGIVNVAQRVDGAPIGLINIVEEGIHEVELVWHPVNGTGAVLRMGGTSFYTAWSLSWRPDKKEQLGQLTPGLAMGSRSDGDIFEWDTDLGLDVLGTSMSTETQENPLILAPRVRTVLRLGLWHHLSPFVGATGHLGIPMGQDAGALPQTLLAKPIDGTSLGWWTAIEGGLRL